MNGYISFLAFSVFVSFSTSVSGGAMMSPDLSDSLAVEKYIERALWYRGQGEYITALKTLDSALTEAGEHNYDAGMLRLLIHTSIIRHILNDYDIALELLFRAERIGEANDNRTALAEINNNIGAIYHTQHEFFKAAEYYNRSIDIYLELDMRLEIGRAYNNFGVLWQDKKEPLTAIDYHRKSLAIWHELNDEGWIGVTNMHLGVCHKLMGDLDSAIVYLNQSAQTIESLKDWIILSLVYAELGNVLMQAGKPEQAARWCLKGLDLATEMGSSNYQHQNCECLFEAYEQLGDEGNALKYYKLYSAFRDSTNNEQKLKEMTRIEMDHSFARKQFADSVRRKQEQVVLELKHQQELANERADRNIAMGIGIGILLLAGALWSRLRFVRRAQRAIQRERDRSDELLLNILPAEIASELKRDGKTKAKRYDEVTILFTDFVQFTATAASMPAADLVEEVNECFTQFDQICDKLGVEKIKTIGDAYMAAGGIPVPDKEAAANVITAALEMQRFIDHRVQTRKAQNLPAFRMRAGIHTGSVVAGVVGVKKFQYDIWGDAVNTSSRLESNSEPGKVNISAATYALVKDHPSFSFQSRGKIAVKGKGEVEMYFVENSKSLS